MTDLFSRLPKPHKGIIGHRGAAALAPENTLSAFKIAAELGVTWVEFDIQCCASGEWVVFHDEILNRTTNGVGLISETPLETIQQLDAGSWFDPKFSFERIPLLKDVLDTAKQLKLQPNIEIKPFVKDQRYKLQELLRQLNTLWPLELPPPLISSFNLEILDHLRSLSSTIPLGYNIQGNTEHAIAIALQHQLDSLHTSVAAASKINFKLANINNLPLLVFTSNEPLQIQEFLKSGASGIFSDLTNNLLSGI